MNDYVVGEIQDNKGKASPDYFIDNQTIQVEGEMYILGKNIYKIARDDEKDEIKIVKHNNGYI